ncbi:hypothetical protein K3152_08670 [Qipengyuania sp. 1NDH17]|uniref:DUF350 domain-containing protein n=1 Tax=Qipengyuania polymorpha TaxID=2867234 RepID=A0ABS7IXM4_9SPHN|nr:hypothetical protein [Qipengyuania polymorpha]MBX7458316.1 hypothetical protein [Qipengyuania polymorpha]
MLQIIGWMGCVYLFVKALELFGAAKARGDGEAYDQLTITAGAIALISAAIFFFLINGQVEASSGYLN